jgi:hypothetical protein
LELDAEALAPLWPLLLGELLALLLLPRLEPDELDELELSRELPVDDPLWPMVLDVSLLGLPIEPLLESRLDPLDPLLPLVWLPLLPLEPVLPLELCAEAWPAMKSMPAMARPRPHSIRFISSPCSWFFGSPAHRRRSCARWAPQTVVTHS